MPSDHEFSTLEAVSSVLQPLSTFTDALSGEKNVTVSAILPLLQHILDKLLVVSCDDYPKAKDMKETIAGSLRAQYAKDTVRKLLSKCTFLDPRFRVECLEDKEETLLQIKDEALDIAEVCTKELSEEQHETAQPPPKKSKGLGAILTIIMAGNRPEAAPVSPGERADQEVKCYLEMPEVDPSFDPLFWWKQHEKKLPIVATLARKYLCV